MIRLNITVEGQTEERFVKNVLTPYLAQHDVYACARSVLTCAQLDDPRFIPYIQLHEFETLILSDPTKLGLEYLEHDAQIARINEMVEREGGNPEVINDGETSAPSKRIIFEIPEYDKVTAGPLVAEKIGMNKLRERCRHFNEWIAGLIELRETQGANL